MLGTSADILGRHVTNEITEIRGSFEESAVAHLSLAMALSLQTMVSPTVDDIVGLQGHFRVADGRFAAEQSSFWGFKFG